MKRLLAFGRRPAAGIDTLRMSRTYERAAKELSDPANAPAVPPTRMEWLRAKVPRLAQLTGGKRSSLVQPATIDAVAKKYPAREVVTSSAWR